MWKTTCGVVLVVLFLVEVGVAATLALGFAVLAFGLDEVFPIRRPG